MSVKMNNVLKKVSVPLIAVGILFAIPSTPQAIVSPEIKEGIDYIKPHQPAPGVALVNTQPEFLWAMLDITIKDIYLNKDIKLAKAYQYKLRSDVNIYGNGHTLDFNGKSALIENSTSSRHYPKVTDTTNLNVRFENLKIKNTDLYGGAFNTFSPEITFYFKDVSQLDSSKLIKGGLSKINLEGTISAPYEVKDDFDTGYISGNHIIAKSNAKVNLKSMYTAIQPHSSFTIEKGANINLTSTRGSAIDSILEYSPVLTNNGQLHIDAKQGHAVGLASGSMILNAGSDTQLNGKTAVATNNLTVKSQATLKASSSAETLQIGKSVNIEKGANFSIQSTTTDIFRTKDPFDAYSVALPNPNTVIASIDMNSNTGLATWKKGATNASAPHNTYAKNFESKFSIFKPNNLKTIDSNNKNFGNTFKNKEVGKIEGGSFATKFVKDETPVELPEESEQGSFLKGKQFNFQMNGLSDAEFATMKIDLDKGKATIQQNNAEPHWYFPNKAYAAILIYDEKGNQVYEKNFVGRGWVPKEIKDVTLKNGYTINVIHQEANNRLKLTNPTTTQSHTTHQINIYEVTTNGLIQTNSLKGKQFNLQMSGLGDSEFATLLIDLEKGIAKFKVNGVILNPYIKNMSYASILIQDENGNQTFSRDFFGGSSLIPRAFDMTLKPGYTITVMHQEAGNHLKLTNKNITYKAQGTNKYQVTTEGLLKIQ
ncbi:putative mucin/carbohydrate-binding domain-containing protein [Listeria rocourtiae]|uniref:putative mucin/carbohydrate-binding domain-containing protein n=1 Tax=Listeria rocourtiae TaxID=647910 RepID=UPI003D2F53A5